MADVERINFEVNTKSFGYVGACLASYTLYAFTINAFDNSVVFVGRTQTNNQTNEIK